MHVRNLPINKRLSLPLDMGPGALKTLHDMVATRFVLPNTSWHQGETEKRQNEI